MSKKTLSSFTAGFTLIELLVVLAIIGTLAGIVLIRTDSARPKARDAKRLSDLTQLQIALEASFEASPRLSQTYPADLAQLQAELFIPPSTEWDNYHYKLFSPSSYCLGVKLELPRSDSAACVTDDVTDNYTVTR